MDELKYTNRPDSYDTTINVIGGLRDCDIIIKAINSNFSPDDSFEDLVKKRNEFNLRTEKSRDRVGRAIRQGFLQFKGQNHKDLIQCIIESNVSHQDQELILLWQFALNNRLFREISTRVFSKVYFSGRASLSKDDIKAYLKEFLSQNSELGISWSEKTINTLSTKYLNLMTKLDFLNAGRTKSFRYIQPSSESIVLFLYFAKLHEPNINDILKSEILPLSLISQYDIRDKLKELSNHGFFNMSDNGINLNIELIHSYEGICHVLYNRSQTEIY